MPKRRLCSSFFRKWRVSLLDDFRSLLIDTYVNFISNFEVAPFIIPSTLPEVSLSFLGANTYLLQPFDWCLLLNSCRFLHHFLGGNHLVRMTKSITVGCYNNNNPVQLKKRNILDKWNSHRHPRWAGIRFNLSFNGILK